MLSSWLRASMRSRRSLSSAAWLSASFTICSISPLSSPTRALDLDRLLLAAGLVLRGDVQDAVRVDVEGDLDLRHAARRRRDPVEDEAPERAVVRGHLALALQHVDLDLRLVVRRRREGLAALGRDRRVALDQLGRDAAERLDAERERRHVEQEHVLHLAREHAGLDRRADRDDLVRVHAAVRLLAEEAPSRAPAPSGCASSRRPARPRRCRRD